MADKIEGCDNLTVTEFDLALDGTTTRLVASGTGHPRAILLDFSQELIFKVTGKMFGICDRLDHGQFLANMRIIAQHMGLDPSPAAPTPAPGSTAAPGVLDPEAASLVQHAAAFRDRAANMIGEMISLGDTLLAIAAHRGSASSADATVTLAPDPPWRVEFSGGAFDVDVDVEKGLIFMLTDESKAALPDPTSAAFTLGESAMMAAVLRAASDHLARALASIVVPSAEPSSPLPLPPSSPPPLSLPPSPPSTSHDKKK